MIRILIATTQPVLAAGLEAILKSGGMDTIDISRDIAEVFESARRSSPDIVIVETSVLPSLAAISDVKKAAPHCQIILWPWNLTDKQVAEAIGFGALGALPASVSAADLVNVVEMLTTLPPLKPAPATLVKRLCDPIERQIVKLVGSGMSNDEIASVMRYDQRSVSKVVKRVSERLDAHDRYELALYGLSSATDVA